MSYTVTSVFFAFRPTPDTGPTNTYHEPTDRRRHVGNRLTSLGEMVRVCACARVCLWTLPQIVVPLTLLVLPPGNFKGGGCAGVNIEFGGLVDAFGLADYLPALIQDWVSAMLCSLAGGWLT